jgi:hypothetical protein
MFTFIADNIDDYFNIFLQIIISSINYIPANNINGHIHAYNMENHNFLTIEMDNLLIGDK